jgi:S1-C subfamily serine protease
MITLALAVVLLAGTPPEYSDLLGPVVKYQHANGSGTAFAIDKDHLMTAAHLVPEKGESWICYGVRPCKHRAVTVRKIDRKLDLAVLRCPGHGLPPVRWAKGTPDKLSEVWLVGCAVARTPLPVRGYVVAPDTDLKHLVRLAAPIYRGMSGGPVYNERGEVFAVNQGALQHGRTVIQFIAFAVPVEVISVWEGKRK